MSNFEIFKHQEDLVLNFQSLKVLKLFEILGKIVNWAPGPPRTVPVHLRFEPAQGPPHPVSCHRLPSDWSRMPPTISPHVRHPRLPDPLRVAHHRGQVAFRFPLLVKPPWVPVSSASCRHLCLSMPIHRQLNPCPANHRREPPSPSRKCCDLKPSRRPPQGAHKAGAEFLPSSQDCHPRTNCSTCLAHTPRAYHTQVCN
jgi:hypothetical protein